MWNYLREIFKVMGMLGAIAGAATWVFELVSVIAPLKTLPQEIQALSVQVRQLEIHVAKIEGKIDGQ